MEPGGDRLPAGAGPALRAALCGHSRPIRGAAGAAGGRLCRCASALSAALERDAACCRMPCGQEVVGLSAARPWLSHQKHVVFVKRSA